MIPGEEYLDGFYNMRCYNALSMSWNFANSLSSSKLSNVVALPVCVIIIMVS